MRCLTVVMMAAVFVAGGCTQETTPVAVVAQKPAQAAATTQPTSQAAGDTGPVMAMVNGQPIPMAALLEVLIRDYGMMPAQQLVADELVRQEALKNNIAITDADIASETDVILLRAVKKLPPPDQRERLLYILLSQMNIPRPMWDMLVRRQAVLHKLADAKVKVTDDQLQDEFVAEYGRNVTVRDIQTATLQDGETILKQLHAVKDPGEVRALFIDLAGKLSTNQATAPSGGLLPTINSKTSDMVILPAIRQQAMAMKKAGDISQLIQTGTAFHILYVEKIEDSKDVKFADVREKLEKAVRDQQVAAMQQEILRSLIENARKDGKIEFVNPVLKAQDIEDQKKFKAESIMRK